MVNLDVALYWTSLAVSAAGIVLFLWLMRDKPEGGRREREGGRDASEGENAQSGRGA